ncbi:MAG TPA: sugar metabolism transcriptional regulator [Crenotrichaceae bacterium]|nr:sugar metabolism transcriptional regulator [Crenotrichaceae bacterium]
MILSELKEYIQTNRRVPLKDLSYRFDVEPDALRKMLQRWVDKGRLRVLDSGTPCASGCSKCPPQEVEIYEWVDHK